ncbi:hypothetical protein L218DRAFT_956993 [Marasmius fiardii PR-910]|nr:hypothetical protein L218DRAFT_956993 [Marasmius fiardii PR-910]
MSTIPSSFEELKIAEGFLIKEADRHRHQASVRTASVVLKIFPTKRRRRPQIFCSQGRWQDLLLALPQIPIIGEMEGFMAPPPTPVNDSFNASDIYSPPFATFYDDEHDAPDSRLRVFLPTTAMDAFPEIKESEARPLPLDRVLGEAFRKGVDVDSEEDCFADDEKVGGDLEDPCADDSDSDCYSEEGDSHHRKRWSSRSVGPTTSSVREEDDLAPVGGRMGDRWSSEEESAVWEDGLTLVNGSEEGDISSSGRSTDEVQDQPQLRRCPDGDSDAPLFFLDATQIATEDLGSLARISLEKEVRLPPLCDTSPTPHRLGRPSSCHDLEVDTSGNVSPRYDKGKGKVDVDKENRYLKVTGPIETPARCGSVLFLRHCQ